MAYIHIQIILDFLQWRQCIASKLHPSGPNRRNIMLQPGFWWLHGCEAVDKNPTWFWHSAYGSQCKSTVLHPSCTLILLHCTIGSDLTHFLHMCMDFIHHWREGPLEPLFEGFIISDSDLMLPHVCTTQLSWFKGKMSWYSANKAWAAAWFPQTTYLSQIDPAVGRESPSSIQLISASVCWPGSCLASPVFWVSISLEAQHSWLLFGWLNAFGNGNQNGC